MSRPLTLAPLLLHISLSAVASTEHVMPFATLMSSMASVLYICANFLLRQVIAAFVGAERHLFANDDDLFMLSSWQQYCLRRSTCQLLQIPVVSRLLLHQFLSAVAIAEHVTLFASLVLLIASILVHLRHLLLRQFIAAVVGAEHHLYANDANLCTNVFQLPCEVSASAYTRKTSRVIPNGDVGL